MMGHQVAQQERFEIINLEEFVPQDHLLRAVDRYLDLAEFRAHLADSYIAHKCIRLPDGRRP
jgi:hypothetical protein